MNNAISRLIESATADATEHAGKPWWEEMSPEGQKKYLSEHPGSSKEEQKSTDVVPHGKKGNDPEQGKPPKNQSTDVVRYSENPVSDNGKKGNDQEGKKTGTDVVPKGRRNDDITDVDFTETPRKKDTPKLDDSSKSKNVTSPDKKSTGVGKPSENKDSGPKSVGGPNSKETPKLKNEGPKWGAEDVDFKETPKGKESPKVKGPEEKEEPESETENKEKPKSESESDEKPGAVDRIKEDEADERARRAEERKEEKHQHQMEVLRKKEEERQADRAEQKKKDAEKDGDKSKDEKSEDKEKDKPSSPSPSATPSPKPSATTPPSPAKKPSVGPATPSVPPATPKNKQPVTPVKQPPGTPPAKPPGGKQPATPGSHPPAKKGEKKEEKKSDTKDEKKNSKTNQSDKRGGEKPESPGSRSDPASEQHKPNSMPNNEGGPNPHGDGESGAGGAVKRLQENGGDFSPVPPSGNPAKPTKPVAPKGPPGAPDDTDVTFEDEPNPNAGPKPPQSKPENQNPNKGPSGAEPEKPGSELSPGLGGESPSAISETPEVEENPGADSESIETPEAPGGDAPSFEQQQEEPGPAEGPEIGQDDVSEPVKGPENIEQKPGEMSEPAPEGNEIPKVETPEQVEQEDAPAEAPEPMGNEIPDAAPPVQPQPDSIPDATPQTPDFGDAPQTMHDEKEDMGQSSPGFSGAPGGMPGLNSGGGSSPTGGPKSDGGGGMPGQTSQPSMRDERGQPAQPYHMKPPGATPDKAPMKPGEPQPQGLQQPGGGVPTKPNSPARSQTADVIRGQAQNIAQRLMQDGEGVPKGLAAMYNILEGRGTAQDGHAAVSLLSSILDNAAAATSTGAGGPLGFATLMAIKHAGVPAMVAIVKKAFGGGMPTVNPEHQQEELTRLVQSAADYAQAGNIPADAWHKGVQEAKQQQGG